MDSTRIPEDFGFGLTLPSLRGAIWQCSPDARHTNPGLGGRRSVDRVSGAPEVGHSMPHPQKGQSRLDSWRNGRSPNPIWIRLALLSGLLRADGRHTSRSGMMHCQRLDGVNR
jgi:hypothetical protein